MSDKKEIYARLAEMIEECSERVRVCSPEEYGNGWNSEKITVINTHQLICALEIEASKEE